MISIQTGLRTLAASAWVSLIGLIPSNAPAQKMKVDRVDIFDAGIYCAETIQKIPEPNAPTGFRGVVSSFKLLKATTRVPAQLGIRFGMRYTIVGAPAGLIVPFRVITRIPPPGLQDPTNGTMLQSDYVLTAPIGTPLYRDYHFEYDWEVVPGVWSLEFWDKERLLATQKFAVSKMSPAQQKNLGIPSCAPPVVSGLTPPTSR